MQVQEAQPQGPILRPRPSLEATTTTTKKRGYTRWSRAAERLVQASFIWPALLVVLVLSIFPLIISLYLSLSRLSLIKGGFDVRFIGFDNYQTLLFGSEQTALPGCAQAPLPAGLGGDRSRW